MHRSFPPERKNMGQQSEGKITMKCRVTFVADIFAVCGHILFCRVPIVQLCISASVIEPNQVDPMTPVAVCVIFTQPKSMWCISFFSRGLCVTLGAVQSMFYLSLAALQCLEELKFNVVVVFSNAELPRQNWGAVVSEDLPDRHCGSGCCDHHGENNASNSSAFLFFFFKTAVKRKF